VINSCEFTTTSYRRNPLRRRPQLAAGILCGVVIIGSGGSIVAGSRVSAAAATGKYSVIDLLVWGADLPIDESGYPPEVKDAIAQHRRRWSTYRSRRLRPAQSSELEMVYLAQVRYERRLVAVAKDGRAAPLARDYVGRLQPCYES
jgi:hypothetical protein